MPKVTMFFDTAALGADDFALNFDFKKVGETIRELVAEAASTQDVPLDKGDVDFIPMPYPRGTLVDNPISIEIETIGFPERKAKLKKEVVEDLKLKIAKLITDDEHSIPISMLRQLVWLKFQDPDGCHV
jgi:hypothetical protein